MMPVEEKADTLYPELEGDPQMLDIILWFNFFDEMKVLGVMPRHQLPSEFLRHKVAVAIANQELAAHGAELPTDPRIIEKIDALFRKRSAH